MSYIIAVAARWTKSVKFTLLITVHTGGLATLLTPFLKKKKEKKIFSNGKSRGPLSARAALLFPPALPRLSRRQ